jgi:hypothetical protein
MRVTLDLDDRSSMKLSFVIIKGIILIGKFPDKIKMTARGFHVIWSNLNISEKKCFSYRKVLGDDK